MKVEIFSLCDFASADAGGKFNVIGIFDALYRKRSSDYTWSLRSRGQNPF